MNGFIKSKSRIAVIAGVFVTAAIVNHPASAAPVVKAPAVHTVANAGASWSSLMHQKLALTAQTTQLTASLPTLRANAVARNADIPKAQGVLNVATAQLTSATATHVAASNQLAAARTKASAAGRAVTAASKRKHNAAGVATARKALTAAQAVVKARAAVATTTGAGLTKAKATYAAASAGVTTATNAYQAALNTITATQARIAAAPATVATLASEASELGPDVVTESRAAFKKTDTTLVYGITVNKVIAPSFKQMIDDATAAGIPLSGGGFRTKQQQIALRVTNGCPDIYTAPSSSCRVPTAIPGRSLHELALAVDITYQGKTIGSHSSPAYKWLAANAAKYGFTNLPSEPWHWSITGN